MSNHPLFLVAVGVVIGGAIMYYIQPTIKLWVAKTFGWEQQLYDYYKAKQAQVETAVPTPTSK